VPGVRGFLNYTKNKMKLPEPTSEITMRKFFSFHSAGIEISPPDRSTSPNLEIGDLVRITHGAFLDYEGKITHLDKKKSRAEVDIEFLDRKISFALPVDNFQKIIT
jgi:transcription antitermination factor NusG